MSLGPESRAILKELSKIRESIAGNLSTNIQQGELFYQQFILDKSSTFTDTEININSFNLFNISVSKNANISSVSFKVLSKTGVLSNEIEARLLPRLAGENARLFISNDTGEASEQIIIDCFTAAPSILGALSTSFRNNEDVFSDSPSDGAAGNNSLSMLSNGMLYDEGNENFSRNRMASSTTILAAADSTEARNSSNIDFYNETGLYIYLNLVTLGGGNLTVKFQTLFNDGSYITMASFGTYTGSKSFGIGGDFVGTITGTEASLEGTSLIKMPRQGRVRIEPSTGDTNNYSVEIIKCI